MVFKSLLTTTLLTIVIIFSACNKEKDNLITSTANSSDPSSKALLLSDLAGQEFYMPRTDNSGYLEILTTKFDTALTQYSTTGSIFYGDYIDEGTSFYSTNISTVDNALYHQRDGYYIHPLFQTDDYIVLTISSSSTNSSTSDALVFYKEINLALKAWEIEHKRVTITENTLVNQTFYSVTNNAYRNYDGSTLLVDTFKQYSFESENYQQQYIQFRDNILVHDANSSHSYSLLDGQLHAPYNNTHSLIYEDEDKWIFYKSRTRYYDNTEINDYSIWYKNQPSNFPEFINNGEFITPSENTLQPLYSAQNIHLTSDRTWYIQGLTSFKNNSVLKIDPGTTIAGYNGTGANTSYLVIDKSSKIFANGTQEQPIIFTSKDALDGSPSIGQWGGIALIGNAGNKQTYPFEINSFYEACGSSYATNCTVDLNDSSGALKHVQILYSGITMDGRELNALSLVGIGSGTIIDNITIDMSDDDAIEIWGGTVNLSNIALSRCTDDYLDIDDGYSGTISNLAITANSFTSESGYTHYGNAAIEISGTSTPTIDGFTITQNASGKEGGIYFKKDNVSAILKNGTIYDNVDDGFGAIHSKSGDEISDSVDINNTIFENITLDGNSSDARFTGTSATTLQQKFHNGSGNSLN